jgi:lia operon protein LiaG
MEYGCDQRYEGRWNKMSGKKGKKLGRFALWVFVIMIISFTISGSIIAANHEYILDRISEGGDIVLKDSKSVDETKSQPADDIKSINVNEVSSEINIIRTDEKEIRAHFYGMVYKFGKTGYPYLDVSVNGNTLNITVKRPNNFFFSFGMLSEDTKLDVYIPEGYTGSVTVTAVSSEVTVSDIVLNSVKIETVSGEINAGNIDSGSIDLASVSGRLSVSGKIGETRLDTVSGDIGLTIDELDGDIEAGTTSGSINAVMAASTEGFTVYFSSVSGTFRSGLEGLSIEAAGNNDVTGTYGNGKYSIHVDTVSGDMTLN